MVTANEQGASVQEEVFKTLLRTPHRMGDQTLFIHKQQFERDPNFYGHLAVHGVLEGGNVVRDVNEIFIANLFASPYQEHREAAYVMFQDLPPYQAWRVIRYFTGYDETVKVRSWEDDREKLLPPKNGDFGVRFEQARKGSYRKLNRENVAAATGDLIPRTVIKLGPKSKLRAQLIKQKRITAAAKEIYVDAYRVHRPGLAQRSVKGMLKKAINSYLAVREADEAWMAGALLRGQKFIRGMYARAHRKEPTWVAEFINSGKAPEGSRLAAMKRLAAEQDPAVQAQIITDERIPLTSAVSVVKAMTAAVSFALVTVMSDQELLANQKSIERRGLLKHEKVKTYVKERLEKIGGRKKGARVDALKASSAAKAVENLDSDIREAMVAITDKQLKVHGQIKLRTMIIIDRSGSMSIAIESGKKLASMIAQACVDGNVPVVCLVNDTPVWIDWKPSDGDITKKSSWDKKLQMFRATGGTVLATAIKAMVMKRIQVEQILLISDEGETPRGMSFAQELKSYGALDWVNGIPNVVVLRVGNKDTKMTKEMQGLGIQVEALEADQVDDVCAVNIINLLSRKSLFELTQEILELPLPTRAEWDEANLKPAAAVAVV